LLGYSSWIIQRTDDSRLWKRKRPLAASSRQVNAHKVKPFMSCTRPARRTATTGRTGARAKACRLKFVEGALRADVDGCDDVHHVPTDCRCRLSGCQAVARSNAYPGPPSATDTRLSLSEKLVMSPAENACGERAAIARRRMAYESARRPWPSSPTVASGAFARELFKKLRTGQPEWIVEHLNPVIISRC
jgi:hypothetical protein